MRAITAVIAAVGVFGVLAASVPARADEDDHDGGGWRRHEWREQQWREQRQHEWRERAWREHAWRAYAPPPIPYAQPGYYAPPPAYYTPQSPPRFYGAPGLSIGFGFGVR